MDLRENGHDAEEKPDHEKGHLFLEKGQKGPRALQVLQSEPSQRPEIQKHQDHGDGDEHRLRHEAQNEEKHDDAIVYPPACPAVLHVGKHGEHEEKGAQDILSLRHPGHGFDVQRVEGKEDRHGGARSVGPRHRCEGEKKKHRVGQVQQQAREVMPAGPDAVELHVEHVGKPRQRVPEIGVEGRESPEDSLQGQPLENVGVVQYVGVVVEIDETEADHLPVDGHRGHDEQDGDQHFLSVECKSHGP